MRRDESAGPLALMAEQATARVGDPFAAEQVICQLIGAAHQACSRTEIDTHAGADTGAAEDAVSELLELVALRLGERAGTGALAALMTLASVAREPVATAARRAVTRVAAAGAEAPAWTGGLGAPAVGRCRRCTDADGRQETLFLVFAYGAAEHVVGLLLDHRLGGGIKDCWVTDEVAATWSRVDELAERPTVTVQDIPAAVAREALRAALAAPPCPQHREQVDSVARHLDLVASRLAALEHTLVHRPGTPSPRPQAPRPRPTQRGAPT